MKTIEEWLDQLPEPYRSQAINSSIKETLNLRCDTARAALSGAFVWADSKEGRHYWKEFFKTL